MTSPFVFDFFTVVDERWSTMEMGVGDQNANAE